MRTCGACGHRARKLQRAVVLEHGGATRSSVCPRCARRGVLIVCGEAHLRMAKPDTAASVRRKAKGARLFADLFEQKLDRALEKP